jgi:hypothetical protein
MQTTSKPKRKNMIWGIHDEELMKDLKPEKKDGLKKHNVAKTAVASQGKTVS